MALEPKRHLSRWHAVPAAHGDGDAAAGSAAVSDPDISLRYLNEFVGKLQCAAALLDHKLYPDSKEITESMGVFNAVRKYVLQDEQESLPSATCDESAPKADGIVVVGDGSTPRTAAMFAHRLRHWKSFSVDPAMEYRSSERSLGWETISNLVVVRNKIENVRITLRRAIIVLVHAHVTLEQALSAVDAEHIVGVVTLPCCNWFREQESLFARPPDLVYDDFSILSDKREVRLWVGGAGAPQALAISSAEEKVCVRKAFRAGTGAVADGDGGSADDDSDAAVAVMEALASAKVATQAKRVRVLQIFKSLLSAAADAHHADAQPVAVRELPAELLPRLEREQHILLLDSEASRAVARSLLQRGYEHVYVFGEPRDESVAAGSGEIDAIRVPLVKLTLSDSSSNDTREQLSDERQGSLRIAARAWTATAAAGRESIDDDEDPAGASSFAVVFEAERSVAHSFVGLDCVVDHRFVYHGFRGESRNAPLFRQLCALVHRVAAAVTPQTVASARPALTLVCVTPRKNWRKKEYLSHEALQFELQSVVVKQAARVVSWDLEHRAQRDQELTYVFCCRQIHRGAVDRVLAAQALVSHQSAKDTVLAMQQTLQQDARVMCAALEAANTRVRTNLSVQQVLALAPRAAEIDPRVVADRTYVQVVGQITTVRRYSKGMAFVSLAPVALPAAVSGSTEHASSSSSSSADAFDPREPLQAFLQLSELAWSPARYHDVLLMLHPGDDIRVLGFCKKSDRGTPLLAVAAIELVRGEFAAYN